MKKYLPLLIIGLMVVTFTGCGSSGGGGVSLVGTWSWTQQATTPNPQQFTGNMVVTTVNGNQVNGNIVWLTPNPNGPYNFQGTLNGSALNVLYTYGNFVETWQITITGSSFSGTWSSSEGWAGTVSGTKVS